MKHLSIYLSQWSQCSGAFLVLDMLKTWGSNDGKWLPTSAPVATWPAGDPIENTPQGVELLALSIKKIENLALGLTPSRQKTKQTMEEASP